MSWPGGITLRFGARIAAALTMITIIAGAPAGAGAFAAMPLTAAHAARAASGGPSAHTARKHRRRRRFPVPSCRWVPTSLIKSELGLSVRALAPQWTTDVAPVLTCSFVERSPQLQFGDVPIVTVQFRELQRFRVTAGSVFVPRLGSCVVHSSCPVAHKSAFQLVGHATGGTPPYLSQFVSGIDLRAEDGLNFLRIVVDNPDGPLPVANEVAAAHKLARVLLPKFRWK